MTLRVLYIERDSGSEAYEQTASIVADFLGLYFDDVDLRRNLLEISERNLDPSGFQLIVSHLQDDPDKKRFDYTRSLARIEAMKSADVPTVVYTGAADIVTDDEIRARGVHAVLRKRDVRDIAMDLDSLAEILNGLGFQRRREPPKRPEVRADDENWCTTVVVRVRLDLGVYAGTWRAIGEACRRWRRVVRIIREPYGGETEPIEVDVKNPLGYCLLSAPDGMRLTVRVEGADDYAATVARRLASGLTCGSSAEPNFYRHEVER
ncbi:hypothetical protein ACFL2T_01080 [Elusimicrobiota bacterium]